MIRRLKPNLNFQNFKHKKNLPELRGLIIYV